MSEAKDETEDEPAKKGRSKLLLVAAVVALVAGGGGFYAVYSGMLALPFLGGGGGEQEVAAGENATEAGDHAETADPFKAAGFVHLEPLIVTLGPQSPSDHLKITLAVEVGAGREAEVEAVLPRVVDILNGFLRAVDEREFEVPRSMERLRAQMLRRVKLVTPEGAVRDLLIQEFVLI